VVVGAGALLCAHVARAQSCESPRPTDAAGVNGVSYGSAKVATFDSASGRVRISYALSGPHAPPRASDPSPAAVVAAANAADAALAKFDELGYRQIVSDGDSPCASNGGDDKVDVYLIDFPSADGQAVPDHCTSSTARSCAGFVMVENDFAGSGYADLTEGMNTVVPHELFHLVQNAYDAGVERWWAEGSAQWAAKQVHPELQDLERHLPAYFKQPWRPLDVPPSGVAGEFLYATAIWPVFLSEQFGHDFVRRVFEGLADGALSPLASTASLLEEEGTSLGAEFLSFAAYNAATGSRASSGVGYDHAADYPLVPFASLASERGTGVDEVSSGLGAFYYAVESSEPRRFTIDADPTRVRALLVPLADGKLALDAALPLPAQVQGSAVVVVAGQSVAKTDAPFRLNVAAGASEPNETGSEDLSSSCNVSRGVGRPGFSLEWGAWALLSFALARRIRRVNR
jgi:hypothetical protein